MTVLNLSRLQHTRRDDLEARSDRLRALRAMLAFAVQEAESLGDDQLAAAISDAMDSAEDALTLDLGRRYRHDA